MRKPEMMSRFEKMMSEADFKTPYTLGHHIFPAFWRHVLPEGVQWLNFPAERRATCSSCPKVAQGLHHPDTRCCTYFPELPNFLLGFALKDESCRGLIEKQIRDGHVLPTGQQKGPEQYRTTAQTYADNLFGELPSQVCPFLDPDTIKCGIYAYRNSVCSTFYCENDHAEAGHHFWEKAQDFIAYLEIALSQAAMQSLGLDVQAYVATLDQWASDIPASYESGGGFATKLREQLWGTWFGREAEFLIATADWVLDRKDELYTLACEQTLYESRLFEASLHDWLPENIRPKVTYSILDSKVPVPSPIDDFRYQLELAGRRLWELPFGQGRWKLSSKLTLPAGNDVGAEGDVVIVLAGQTAESPKLELMVSLEKLGILELFRESREFNEALMDSKEIQAVEDNREFLAECLRLGMVIEDTGKVGKGSPKLPIV